MPDAGLPHGWRMTLRVSRLLLYALTAGMGISGILLTPSTLVGTVGEPLMVWWATFALLGSLLGMCGVASGKYRLEWVATWPVAGGILAYAATVWTIVFVEGSPTRSMQALGITALGLSVAIRGFMLAAHAAKLRRQHYFQESGLMDLPQEGGRD